MKSLDYLECKMSVVKTGKEEARRVSGATLWIFNVSFLTHKDFSFNNSIMLWFLMLFIKYF